MAYQRWWKTVRDQQGNAINGANCAVYNGGTGTLATVYDPNTDDSAPGGLSNPFTTTANGVFGFMAADGEYDVQISGGNGATQQYRVRLSSAKTSDLEAQWQADDAVVAADAAAATALVRSDLSATTGAGLVGYLAPYTGAVARRQHDKNADYVSVKDFGAVGDGVADDTAAIQIALNAGDVFFPDGIYLHSGGLLIPSNRAVCGSGNNAILRKSSGTFNSTFLNSDYLTNAVGNTDISIQNLCFEENGVGQGYDAYVHVVVFIGVARGSVKGCTFKDISGDGIYVSSTIDTTARSNYSKDICISDNHFLGTNTNRNGVSIIDATGTVIVGNTFEGMGASGMPGAIDLEPNKATQRVVATSISGNTFRNCIQAVQAYNSVSATCGTLSISANTVDTIIAGSYAISVISFVSTTINGNAIYNCPSFAIYASGSSILTISSNSIYFTSSIALWVLNSQSSVVSNNSIFSPGSDGIRFTGAGAFACVGNSIKAWGISQSAIKLDGCSDGWVSQNSIDGESRATVGIYLINGTAGIRGLDNNFIVRANTPFTMTSNNSLGSAAPTGATWRIGERCVNIAPTVGQPKAWVCTVAGTPGTWVSEGNL